MTKQDFDKYLDELTSETGFDLTKEQKAFAYQAAKEYHEQASGNFYIFKHKEEGNFGHFGQTFDEALDNICLKTGLKREDFEYDCSHVLL